MGQQRARRHDGLALLYRPLRAEPATTSPTPISSCAVHRRGQDLVLADRPPVAEHHVRACLRPRDAGYDLGSLLRPARHPERQRDLRPTLLCEGERWRRPEHRLRGDLEGQFARVLPGKPITSVIVDPKIPQGKPDALRLGLRGRCVQIHRRRPELGESVGGAGAAGGSQRACRLILHHDGTLFCLVTALRKDGRFVAAGPGLYRSVDGGKSWNWINQSRPLLWPKDFDVDPRDSQVIYLGAADAGNEEGGLYKTTDGGAIWNRIARNGDDCFGATIDPRHPGWVYMCIPEGDTSPASGGVRTRERHWDALDGMPFRNAQRITFDPGRPLDHLRLHVWRQRLAGAGEVRALQPRAFREKASEHENHRIVHGCGPRGLVLPDGRSSRPGGHAPPRNPTRGAKPPGQWRLRERTERLESALDPSKGCRVGKPRSDHQARRQSLGPHRAPRKRRLEP